MKKLFFDMDGVLVDFQSGIDKLSDETKKDIECLHCEHFFDCNGKPKEVQRCINYKERKKGNEG